MLPDVKGFFMSHSKHRHDHKEGKKQHKDSAPVSRAAQDASLNPKQPDFSNTKPFDEIIKGFQEIEKIEHTDSAPASQNENDESAPTKKPGSSKAKSYAEIIKGFQEIEKIISNSQKTE
jgi:hypothetical protein